MAEARFPKNFVWGAATASYQIEGAVAEDGRSPTIWDTFSHTPGKVANGDTGDAACDHYHRWPEDVALMQRLGLQAYRFSVAWPRVLPGGVGQVNTRGLDFYDRLVDALLAANITPYTTLYHWDLPQVLQDQGGWDNRDTVNAFVEFADVVARRLGDRVKQWITHNEPWVVSIMGNMTGEHAPGLRDPKIALQVAHHVLLSHGRSVPVIRAASPGAQVGITLNLASVYPMGESEEDAVAVRRMDGFFNRWFLDPVFGRGYPADLVDLYGAWNPHQEAGDLDEMAAPTDFLGINNYQPSWVRPGSWILGAEGVSGQEMAARGYEVTAMDWPVVPRGLYDLLVRVHRDYAPPVIYVTENGAAYADLVVNGKVEDPQRISYLDRHLRACAEAIESGVPLRGYFLWSLLDNFEWAWGYDKRFGIIYVDYATQARIPKASAAWYSRFIEANGLV